MSVPDHGQLPPDFVEDPTLQNARREFMVVATIALIVMGWDIAVCVTDGFAWGKATPELWLGVPRWALLGIIAPWIFMLGVNYWFGLWFVVEDDLSRDDLAEAVAEMEEVQP